MTKPTTGPRYDIPNAAPPPLRIVQEFVNTVDHDHGREWLGSPAELRDWLVARRLLPVGSRVRGVDLARAVELRGALHSLLATGRPSGALDRAARDARLTIAFDGAALVPQAAGVAGALGLILVVVVESMRDGSLQRLKTCQNCHWAFYDYSKNRSGSWCSMQLCGNRSKTRAYYRRRAGRS